MFRLTSTHTVDRQNIQNLDISMFRLFIYIVKIYIEKKTNKQRQEMRQKDTDAPVINSGLESRPVKQEQLVGVGGHKKLTMSN